MKKGKWKQTRKKTNIQKIIKDGDYGDSCETTTVFFPFTHFFFTSLLLANNPNPNPNPNPLL